MPRGLVLPEVHGAKRTAADLIDDTVATAHAQTAHDYLTALGGKIRCRTHWSFSAHYEDPLDSVGYPYIIAGE